MVRKPKRPCSHPGCRALTSKGRCPEHTNHMTHHDRQRQREYDKQRGTTAERGYGHRWQKARKGFLLLNPLCVHCRDRGIRTSANVVDHIIPHKGDSDLFWSKENWQSLCFSCHSTKTVKEDGGFGNDVG